MFMDISTVNEILQNEKAAIQTESIKWGAAFLSWNTTVECIFRVPL